MFMSRLQINTTSTLSALDAPVAFSEMSNQSTVIEDTTLYQCGLLISDIKMLERKVMEFWNTHISVILPAGEETSTSPSGQASSL